MRVVHQWLRELVDAPDAVETVARELGLRGFEVAEVETRPQAVIDFEITANRPDCLSHIGLAREASVIWSTPLRLPETTMPAAGPAEPLEVRIDDADLCPRYCAQVFEVQIGPSPAWLAKRLTAAGIRPINNVVDVSNYVMLEFGQPTHAFDLERLADRTIVVRRARAGERLRLLDGSEHELGADVLVIADAAHASAIGGVMGGQASEVGPSTRRIALESAYFHPASVRRASRQLGIKTEASTRFERGADVEAPPVGIARAAALLGRIGAGRPLGALIDRYPAPRPLGRITLRSTRIVRVLGQEVPAPDVPRILEPLGFGVAPVSHEASPAWTVTVPSFRVDVDREVDLIEEVGRHYAFDRLPATFPPLWAPQSAHDPKIATDRLVRQVMTARGFSEAMTFAFIQREAALPFCEPGTEAAAIANPLSEKFAVLRPSLLPGLIDSCAYNRRRERRDVRLFETASRFTAEGEGRAAAFIWSGAAEGPHWSGPTRNVDFFDAKAVVEQLAAAFGIEAEFAAIDRPFLAPGRAAEVSARRNGSTRRLGILGQLLPPVLEARGFPPVEEVYAAEIDLARLAAESAGEDLKAESLPRFPSIVRDLSIAIDEALPAASVRGTIRSAAPSTLVSVVEFDRYQGKGVPEGRVSLSVRLTFRTTDRTLTDAEVQDATDRIVEALRTAHGAEQR